MATGLLVFGGHSAEAGMRACVSGRVRIDRLRGPDRILLSGLTYI